MRILEVCVDLDGGGIDRYLLNYCGRIKDIQFDFAIVDKKTVGILEPEIEALGSRIFRVPRQRAGIRANYNALKKILTENHYDAVHVHLGYRGALALLCAKNCGVKTRIVHAHIAYETEGFKQKCIRKASTVITKMLATHLAACGVDAGKWVWGEKTFASGKVTVHNNAIDAERFRFKQDVRQAKREELGLAESTLAVGHVGRISLQKNQHRLVDIFAEINKRKPDSKLLIVGRGTPEDEQKLKEKVQTLGLEEKVVFLGVRSDVHALLNAFDVFPFPSLFEGLPFTLIETQCNGLPAVSADTVTPLVNLGQCVRFLSLDETDEKWATVSLEEASRRPVENAHEDVIRGGYDIETEAKKLVQYYENCVQFVKV